MMAANPRGRRGGRINALLNALAVIAEQLRVRSTVGPAIEPPELNQIATRMDDILDQLTVAIAATRLEDRR